MITEAEVIVTRSVAEIVETSDLHPIRKWLLAKLMPKALYEAPPVKLGEFQKGERIGKIVIEHDSLSGSNDMSLSGGYSKEFIDYITQRDDNDEDWRED